MSQFRIKRNRKPKKPVRTDVDDFEPEEPKYNDEIHKQLNEVDERLGPKATQETSQFLMADFNYKLNLISEYIKKAPINDANQDKLQKKLDQLEMGDNDILDEILKEAEYLSTEGDILLKTISKVLDSLDESQILTDDEKEDITKKLKSAGKKYSEDSITLNQALDEINADLSSYVEEGRLPSQVSELIQSSKETNQLLRNYDPEYLENIITTRENALRQELVDNLPAFQAMSRVSGLDKQVSDITESDLYKLLEDRSGSIDDRDKELIQQVLDVINDKDKLLPTTLQTLTEQFQALNNETINKMLESDNLTNAQLLQAIKDLQATTEDLDQQFVLKQIAGTLSNIETLQEESQLSNADRIKERLDNASMNTTLNNIDEYLSNMTDNDKEAKKMFSGKASSMEEVGEEAADYLLDLFDGSDLGKSIDRGKRKVKNKVKGAGKSIKNAYKSGGLKGVGKQVIKGGASAVKSMGGFLASGAGSLAKTAVTKAGPVGAVIQAGMSGYDYFTAEDSATRKEAVGEGVGGGLGSVIGGALGTLIPIPGVGTVAGAALGGWLGNKIGGWFSKQFTDIKDYIPDNVKGNPEAELAYIDNALIPDMISDPAKYDIDEDNKDKVMNSLEDYRSEVARLALKNKHDKENTQRGLPQTTEETVQNMIAYTEQEQEAADLEAELKQRKDKLNKQNEPEKSEKKDDGWFSQAFDKVTDVVKKVSPIGGLMSAFDWAKEKVAGVADDIMNVIDGTEIMDSIQKATVTPVSEAVPDIVKNVVTDVSGNSKAPNKDVNTIKTNKASEINALRNIVDTAPVAQPTIVTNNTSYITNVIGTGNGMQDTLTQAMR